jgi:predicted ATP-dependent endonuclease of OLD family
VIYLKLTLRNIGKIKDAEIELNGITVLAGENNTGKSTAGKALYSLLNAFYDVDEKIAAQKKTSILNEINRLLHDITTIYSSQRNAKLSSRAVRYNIACKIVNQLDQGIQFDSLVSLISEIISNDLIHDRNSEMHNTTEIENKITASAIEIANSIKMTNEEIYEVFINRSFNDSFEHQINHINHPKLTATVMLTGDIPLEVSFVRDTCNYVNYQGQDLPEPVYIDANKTADSFRNGYEPFEFYSTLRYKLHKVNNDLASELEEAKYLKKIGNTLDVIDRAIAGELCFDDEGSFVYQDKSLIKAVNTVNLSEGIKSFAIIKRLLKNRQLTERTVLIIDEPETHLHPEWQLAFAEILVSLQKDLNMTLMLATHSPYFLNAIEVFSAKYNVKDKCRYYLTENANDDAFATITDVTESTELIYAKLSAPLRELRKLRYGDDNE